MIYILRKGLKFLLLPLFFVSNIAFAASPQVGIIAPSSGTSNPNETVSFTTTCSDPDGWLNIQYIHLLINTSTSGAYCFYGDYDQNTNNLYLRKGGYSINIPLAD